MAAKKKVKAFPKKAPLPLGENTALNRELVFSFKFYDEQNTKKYCLSKFNDGQIRIVLERLRENSRLTLNELRQQGKFYHFHEVDWTKTTERNGFQNKELSGLEPFQFALPNVNQQLTRVYGAMSGHTFYIVWFDLNHKIWPTQLRNT